MLRRFVPSLSTQARHTLLKPSIFPCQPRFFSATARRFNNISTETTADENTDEEPTPTNLDSHPKSISCTVSPPPTYAFLKPTPVVLLTGPFGDTWQATLADQGYQSTSIELAMPPNELESGDAYIRYFTNVLKTSIETDHSFFPPILIAHGLHALVAQKYVESNPVSALVLVSPFIPELVKGRFSELSRKLQLKRESEKSERGTEKTTTTSATLSSSSAIAAATEGLDFNFKTHADVLAQDGFREMFVLPKKAVYKIDQVAKDLQEKEKSMEKERAKKEVLYTREEQEAELEKRKQEHGETILEKDKIPEDISSSTPTTKGIETIGSTAKGAPNTNDVINGNTQEDTLPIMTVESEASIPSPLEQLPLAIYDSIPISVFEPTFPILLVTCNADEIVSTADVKEHHILSGQVDHIELEDLDDGGHLIMVSDNTEWEQGIEGITAWLDSNGM
ncbi:hypothetical protein BGZ49_001359 [Haplosporangium sp. Z 27]|nr:hypothetical protein BGZ49_001359 [Haplosporangium sp. Z 27]